MERQEGQPPVDPLEAHAKSLGYNVDDPMLYSSQGLRGGIRCPYCKCAHHKVNETRQSEHKVGGKVKEYIRRWRECLHCHATFATREVLEPEIPDEIKTPRQGEQVARKIGEVLENVLPVDPGRLEDLPNPFLK